jgi:hypothetical protein
MIRSVTAVLAGIAVLTATSFAIEAVANPVLLSLFPNALPNVAALKTNLLANLFLYCYTAVCLVAGGYVTAWVAPRAPVRHALAMGVIQVGLTVWAMFSFPHQAPLRNWVVGLVTTVPAGWLGGILRARIGAGRQVAQICASSAPIERN